ncbi:hypothetical protein I3843_03G045100 [Carya illinoinensis]|uniref:Uncharacterized protein n=1 Tax=Carya illinoinensis TaxID=32201 RepID=A0A8T1QYK7_CARIL|nr:hypothetical protein I3760_03G042000 [Carya illinoinensis]KAG6659626.1 hypothetical protein CIPAW_03G048900 [Carya illinoinensis]KAG6720124.1 hypothetical protein I3842_03G043800 [Carya illinoinensis]KAG7985777.1 hypothetical protein I3843_03G045100 [Carya illinoinensis]
MKLLAVAGFLVFLVSIEVRTNCVQGSTRLSLVSDSTNLEPFQYVTVSGCNNDCDTACCNCDIRKQPPLCVQCCQE